MKILLWNRFTQIIILWYFVCLIPDIGSYEPILNIPIVSFSLYLLLGQRGQIKKEKKPKNILAVFLLLKTLLWSRFTQVTLLWYIVLLMYRFLPDQLHIVTVPVIIFSFYLLLGERNQIEIQRKQTNISQDIERASREARIKASTHLSENYTIQGIRKIMSCEDTNIYLDISNIVFVAQVPKLLFFMKPTFLKLSSQNLQIGKGMPEKPVDITILREIPFSSIQEIFLEIQQFTISDLYTSIFEGYEFIYRLCCKLKNGNMYLLCEGKTTDSSFFRFHTNFQTIVFILDDYLEKWGSEIRVKTVFV